ncbi:MAG TPA: succinyldiaminopimelate transaminase [Thiotrichales bacterium]|nr:succinyldiaminopimelate transaminase [Thiotrichales bacterium]
MNPDLDKLQPYPFQKLSTLFDGITPASDKSPIRLSIGEPKHPTPDFIHAAMRANLNGLASYPLTRGSDDLREAITNWLTRRFNLPTESLNPARHILPVNGTREALFAFAQTMIDRNKSARVLMPNPFYQIYEGAALLAGAEPEFLNCTAENDFIPDFDAVSEQTWQDCQLLYLCSPGNPTGAVIPESTLQKLIERAIKYNFVIASDECYSEIYQDEKNPPPGLLGAAANMGNTQYKNCMVFHSLSKRSNAPGMRSGFVAGDAELINRFHLFRTYHGCAMSATTQAASTAAWKDETHVQKNREAYREKYSAVHSDVQ